MGLLVNTMRTEEKMNETQIREQIEGLRHMTVGQLKDKYLEAFGEESRSNHKQFLFRRIAWRLQANAWAACRNVRAGEPWRSPTTPISAFALRRTS
jgi:hypothetical protein